MKSCFVHRLKLTYYDYNLSLIISPLLNIFVKKTNMAYHSTQKWRENKPIKNHKCIKSTNSKFYHDKCVYFRKKNNIKYEKKKDNMTPFKLPTSQERTIPKKAIRITSP